MANPAWFNYSTYMANKLASLQAADPDAGWTADSVAQAFADAGFTGVEGAYDHFNQYGNSADENLSPNDLFVPDQYYKFKAKDYFEHDSVSEVTAQEAAFIKTAIHDAGMSAWQHYIDYGTKEGVNPSNAFDTQKYLEAKAAALNAAEGVDTWTADSVADAFAAAGMNALSHAIEYSGKGDNEAAAVFDESGAVVDAYKVDDKTSDDVTTTFTLTPSQDNIVGTSGDDVVEAPITDGKATLTSGDKIDGGAGTDTLNVYSGGFTGVTMSNVEIVNDYIDAAYVSNGNDDVTGLSGVTNYNFMAASQANVKANVATAVGFSGAQGNLMTVTFADASGTDDAATIALSDATVSAATLTVNDVETLTLNLTGTNIISGANGIAADSMTSLVVTGDGSLAKDKDGAKLTVASTGLLKSVDASAATGDLALTLANANLNATAFAYDGSAGADKIDLSDASTKLTVKTGAGDDTVLINSTKMGAESTIDGGDGSDTLGLTTDDATDEMTLTSAADVKFFSNFETLSLTATDEAITVDQSVLSGVSAYKVAATGSAVTLNNLTDGVSVSVSDATSAITATLKDASAADSTITLTLDNGGTTTAANGVAVTAGNLETNAHILSVVSAGKVNTTHNSIAMDDAALASVTNVKISGDQALDLSVGASNVITKIDGSTAEGALDINVTASGEKVVVLGGSGDDTFTSDGAKVHTFTGNGGADKFVSSHDAASTAATMVITDFVSGTDSIVTAAATAGAKTNFTKATSTSDDLDAILADATAAGTTYYVGQVTGGATYLLSSDDNMTTVKDIIQLSGIDLGDIVFGDIVAA